MKTASITEAKNQLSALLDVVRKGETVLILDRNRPIARIEPVTALEGPEAEGRLADLERSGLLRRARKPLSKSFLDAKPPKAQGKASILQALLSERREGR